MELFWIGAGAFAFLAFFAVLAFWWRIIGGGRGLFGDCGDVE